MIETIYMSQGPAYLQAADGALSPKGFTPATPATPRQELTREDRVLVVQELSRMRNGGRSPRRSRTTHEHMPAPLSGAMVPGVRPRPPASPSGTASPTDSEGSQAYTTSPAEPARAAQQQAAPQRPKLGPPRRSYSVMDYEPVPPEQQPSSRLPLEELPSEIHYAIFDFLDPIDSTCLGLTNSHFYTIHRRMHGSVPLSARRNGPNELEWAWHLAGALWSPKPASPGAPAPGAPGRDKTSLAGMRVQGKGLCRKCGVSRCELHKHIRGWLPENYEYCSVRDKFVPRPEAEAKAYCYLSSPKDSHRCGRHRVRKAKEAAAAAE